MINRDQQNACPVCRAPREEPDQKSQPAPAPQRRNGLNGEAATYIHPENFSQYSKGVVAGCTIMCLEAAYQFEHFANPSRELVGTILNNASDYKEVSHTAVLDVLNTPAAKKYRDSLEIVNIAQKNLPEMKAVLKQADDLARKGHGVAVVITKPPESVMAYFYGDRTLVFDSHSRPGYDGAHILEFDSHEGAGDYLMKLFAVDPSVADVLLYNIFDATFLVRK